MARTLVLDRRIPRIGRINRATGTTNLDTFETIDRRITELLSIRDFETLRKVKSGSIALIELVQMDVMVDARSRHVRPERPAKLVYVVLRRDTSEVKIGIATDVRKRVATLRASHAMPIEVLAVFPGGRKRELRCHRMFADVHIRGEWFRATPRLLKWAARNDRRENPTIFERSSPVRSAVADFSPTTRSAVNA